MDQCNKSTSGFVSWRRKRKIGKCPDSSRGNSAARTVAWEISRSLVRSPFPGLDRRPPPERSKLIDRSSMKLQQLAIEWSFDASLRGYATPPRNLRAVVLDIASIQKLSRIVSGLRLPDLFPVGLCKIDQPLRGAQQALA